MVLTLHSWRLGSVSQMQTFLDTASWRKSVYSLKEESVFFLSTLPDFKPISWEIETLIVLLRIFDYWEPLFITRAFTLVENSIWVLCDENATLSRFFWSPNFSDKNKTCSATLRFILYLLCTCDSHQISWPVPNRWILLCRTPPCGTARTKNENHFCGTGVKPWLQLVLKKLDPLTLF